MPEGIYNVKFSLYVVFDMYHNTQWCANYPQCVTPYQQGAATTQSIQYANYILTQFIRKWEMDKNLKNQKVLSW